jgi:hypothetical protein
LRLDRNSLNRGGEPLREDADELWCRRDIDDADLAVGNLLSNKMKFNLHRLGALMLNGVGEEVHGIDVIAVYNGAPRRRSLELVEQLLQPSGHSHAVGNGTILGLSVGAWDDGLLLGRPGNQVVPQEHRIA